MITGDEPSLTKDKYDSQNDVCLVVDNYGKQAWELARIFSAIFLDKFNDQVDAIELFYIARQYIDNYSTQDSIAQAVDFKVGTAIDSTGRKLIAVTYIKKD